ncbi:sigma-54-dependent Fis family transcriptional regulator [candidate division KSB1 bacterium]|nr:sigma-54-dependent Fis family transcriptional regulator [candidate division KSB1 bacterium]MBL7095778.1 sigma-54-dependent Fis family transcriptional regulator [candidate division KSB1 bacterium]
MPNEKILIIDDDPQIRMLLKDRLEANGYLIFQAENGIKGFDVATKKNPDLILLDLNMPEMDGFEVLTRLNRELPETTVVILTAHGTIERAVEAMKLGAYDFLPKPSKPDHILLVVKKALERKDLKDENIYLRKELENQYQMVVGESSEMKKIMDTVQKIGKSKTTVLIQGETGTGKQLMARFIHNTSDRKGKPFVQVNCTTLSEQLMESDLFGHEKGAFTGAIKQKKGRFELANNGTLFLDEIGDLSPAIQAKLLHVLEYGEFQRVGGVETHKADVRILTATNKDLQTEVDEGRFREDLFYRLNVMGIQLPPLRARPGDIAVFADYFLKKHNKSMSKNLTGITSDTMEILKRYSWPGNIRELENVIERAVVLVSGEEITSDLLPPFTGKKSTEEIEIGTPLDMAVIKFKKRFIYKTLKSLDNNQTKAAELLKIQRTYLNRLIKELGLKFK